MKLSELIKRLEIIHSVGDLDVDVKDVKTQSNSVTKGCLFVCNKGRNYDGHDYVLAAEKFGALAIVAEYEVNTNLPLIIVKDSRKALAIIASEFYLNPSKNMSIIGVVGTNGKTTTSHLIYETIKNSGIKCGVIGTLGTFYCDKFYEPTLTTPDPMELHKIFAEMYHCGVEIVVMEVSAHAIYWNKVYGIDFEVGVFTNLSRDHLDFFRDIKEYTNTKLKFFTDYNVKYTVVNSDDEVGLELLKLNNSAVSYGLENPADVFAIKVRHKDNKTSFVLNLFDCIYKVETMLVGKYNLSNTLAAATAVSLVGVKPDEVCKNLQKVKGVEGRLQLVYNDDYKVYVDYAHTPDGLEKVLLSLRLLCKRKLIVVFGCGGNRDVGKREHMGEVAKKIADFVVVTSDNPRYEEPMTIISEIEKGVLKIGKEYVLIEDRTAAIEYALNLAKAGDLVLIAGKGGENYQEVLGIKLPYNDKDTVIECLRRRQS